MASSTTPSPAIYRPPEPIPAPLRFDREQGHCRLTAALGLTLDAAPGVEAEQREAARSLLTQLHRQLCARLPDIGSEGGGAQIRVRLGAANLDALERERYTLRLSERGIEFEVCHTEGLFRGIQTLWQCLPIWLDPLVPEAPSDHGAHGRGPLIVSGILVEDQPRFAWRGYMLDTCRHFFTKAEIMAHMSQLARWKINVFHLHLTDDQGWRVDIDAWPKLREVASFRSETPTLRDRNIGDGQPHGGCFTKSDLREIVAHGAALHMRVMPEIEMPGHARAALAAYPELGNMPERQLPVATTWGIHDVVFGVGDATFRFLESVLDEVLEVFPSPFVHVGGDEVPKREWQASSQAQAKIKELGLADEDELQSAFIRHFDSYLAARGRRLVGWDEILEGGLAPGATVMSWRGTDGGIAAARAGHDVVMCPTTHAYFDYYQARDRSQEPPAAGGYIPLVRVYAFEPVPAELEAEHHHHILGGQANLWTECIPTVAQLEYQSFPRLLAMAEVLWSAQTRRDYADFLERLQPVMERLSAQGVRCRRPTGEPHDDPAVPAGEEV